MKTLFHGARDYFRRDIEADGLGAQCLAQRFRIPELLQEGLDVLCGNLPGDYSWRSDDFAKEPTHLLDGYPFIKRAALQTGSSSLNFTHKFPWFAVDRDVALNYARHTPEIIRFAFSLVDRLEAEGLISRITERTFLNHWTPERRNALENSDLLVLSVAMQNLPMDKWFLDSGRAITNWPSDRPPIWERNCLAYEYRGAIPANMMEFHVFDGEDSGSTR